MLYEKYSPELLNKLASKARSIREVINLLGLKQAGGTYCYLKKVFIKHNIDTSHFTGQRSNRGITHKGGNKKKKWQDILIKRSSRNRENILRLRRALIESGRPYKCSGNNCIIESDWLGKSIVLQIDHINGDFTDCLPENLRFLCPNCHSQTPNYGTKGRFLSKPKRSYIKNKKIVHKKFCIKCNIEISLRNKTNLCKSCFNKLPRVNKRNIKYPTKEELEILIHQLPMTKIGQKFGVTDNAVKKWVKKLGIILPNHLGFWTKEKPIPQKEEIESKLLDFTISDLSKFYYVSDKTIKKWIRIYKLKVPDIKFRSTRQWQRRRDLLNKKLE